MTYKTAKNNICYLTFEVQGVKLLDKLKEDEDVSKSKL